MTDSNHFVGEVLDDKYRLERLLGSGGMGAVYLATHLGTERYVALKLIAPQLMRNEEFVERFKREARAAGRLRHPNVVDVTDFGFAHAGAEAVAYLVMEYLDGCTLGDVLSEEKRLPLEWVVDILEQVCSAVHEAHQQGIVHRDLKPDNIWLEPNRLGGYRVKVLDFGIAKLAEANVAAGLSAGDGASFSVSAADEAKATRVLLSDPRDRVATEPREASNLPLALSTNAARDLETDTLLYTAGQLQEPLDKHNDQHPADSPSASDSDNMQLSAQPTAIAPLPLTAKAAAPGRPIATDHSEIDGDRTLLLDRATRQVRLRPLTAAPTTTSHGTELTRVGAIMGTPLYMSPEQCRGKELDARSDIYSLGVIAYQMLAGEPPFSGDMPTVMREHMETAPQPLRERARKLPKRVAEVVMAALDKDPAHRPQTAEALASSLRAQAEGIGSLYRRAFSLYSEYFPKFLRLSLIAHLPVILFTLLMIGAEFAEKSLVKGSVAKVAMIVVIVVLALLQVASYILAGSAISGVTAVIVTQLSAAPLRPVELRTAFAVVKKRWKPFLKTSVRVALRVIIGFALLIIPGIVMYARYVLTAPVVLMEGLEKKAAMRRSRELAGRSWRTVIIVSVLQFVIPMAVRALVGGISVSVHAESAAKTSKISMQPIYQQLSGLLNIFVVPLMSIVPALLYLKMRQLGGETLTAALAQIEEVDSERSKWRKRMRSRLSLPTPRSQKSTP